MKRFFQINGRFLFFVCFLFLPAQTWGAGQLEIEVKTTTRVEGDQLHVLVAYTNKGSSPAFQVQAHLNALGVEEDALISQQLDPGASDTVRFVRDLRGIHKGRYPLLVSVDFHDSNRYPFSALSGMTFFKDKDVNPRLVAEVEGLTLRSEGRLQFDIQNLEAEPRRVRATLFVPREISAAEPLKAFSLEARGVKQLFFELSNFSALPGAAYPVFCFLEYDADQTHHTALAQAVVKIGEQENVFRRFRWLWIALIVLLAGCLVVGMARERKKGPRS